MTASTFGAALATGLAVSTLLGPRPTAVRLQSILPRGDAARPHDASDEDRAAGPRHGRLAAAPDSRPTAGWTRTVALVALGASLALVVGGGVGLAAGVAAGAAARRWLAGLETSAERAVRRRTTADLPLAAELLRATLEAGAPLGTACAAVASAVGGRLGDGLASGARALALGLPPRDAWSSLVSDPVTARLGRLLVLTAAEGTAPATALGVVAADVRADSRAAAEARARALGASVAAPLGLCFLPGFLLLGVVPLVAAAATGLAL
jgi:pilus assembly protein TadC